MTRLEAGTLKPRSELVDLADVVGSALRRVHALLLGHEVQITIPRDVPMIRLDPVLFEQVLFNLLDNAAKYSDPESRITIAAHQTGNTIALSVSDEGDGIPEADVERIFDKFYRAGAEDRQRAGTGLGLAICRGFVEAMGGTIAAANRENRKGARFTITLPVPAETTMNTETPV